MYMYYYTDLLKEMIIVGKSCSKFSATKDQQLSVKECRLKLLIHAQAITPVDASYDISANGLWGGKFEFPENSQLISGVCHISISSSSQFNRPVTVQLEYCANIMTRNKQNISVLLLLNLVHPSSLNTYQEDHLSWFTVWHYTSYRIFIAWYSTLCYSWWCHNRRTCRSCSW